MNVHNQKGHCTKKEEILNGKLHFLCSGVALLLSCYILTGFLGDSKGEIPLMKS